jgi:hypothetical protein
MASVHAPELAARAAAQQIANAVADASASMHSLAAHLAQIAVLAVGSRNADAAERLAFAARCALLDMQAHDRLVQELAAVCEGLGTPIPGMPIRGAYAVDSQGAERGSIELF